MQTGKRGRGDERGGGDAGECWQGNLGQGDWKIKWWRVAGRRRSGYQRTVFNFSEAMVPRCAVANVNPNPGNGFGKGMEAKE